jgi:hypothetical protein
MTIINKVIVNSGEGIRGKVFKGRCSEEGKVRECVIDANQGPL